MSLIIEDGTIVTNADSYASAADLVTFATNYGYTIPSTTGEQEILLRQAMLTVDTKTFQGYRADESQSLSFPRTGVYVDNILLPSDEIPSNMINAQLTMAVESNTTDFLPTVDPTDKGSITHEEVVGAVVRKYAANSSSSGSSSAVPVSSKVETLLRPLTKGSQKWLTRA